MWRPGLTLLMATLLAACGSNEPESQAGGPPPGMPADHPPVPDASPPARRLAPDTVLATVGGETITAADLDAVISAMPGPERLEYSTPEMVRDLLDGLVDRKLMARAARAAGLAPEAAAAGSGDEQLLASAWREAELARVPRPTDGEAAAYYREHEAEFRQPARVQVTRATAADAPRAARLRDELARGATAGELQAQALDFLSGAGQVWLQETPKPTTATAAALALQPGEVSGAIPVRDGFLVMRADQVFPARQRPLDEVRAGILTLLEDGRRQEAEAGWRDRLRAGVSIQLHEARIASYP